MNQELLADHVAMYYYYQLHFLHGIYYVYLELYLNHVMKTKMLQCFRLYWRLVNEDSDKIVDVFVDVKDYIRRNCS